LLKPSNEVLKFSY